MKRGVVTTLRDVVPIRPLTMLEALRIAELQANKLLELSGVDGPPIPEGVISGLPRIQVERLSPSPVSGAAQWSRGRWLILLNGGEPHGRQRFSLAHEFKHILDNPFIAVLYPNAGAMTSEARAEQVADYFAACLWMPRRWLKREWATLGGDIRRLARRFEVSQTAMHVRLLQVGLVDPTARCQQPQRRKEANHAHATRNDPYERRTRITT